MKHQKKNRIQAGIRILALCSAFVAISHFLVGGCGPDGDWSGDKAYLSIMDATAAENGDTAEFMITLTEPSITDITVPLTITGTATKGTDYQTISSSITITAGETVKRITVTPIDDSLVEADESIIITMGDIVGYTVVTDQGTITISSEDRPTVSVSATTDSASEGGAGGIFKVELDSIAYGGLPISYTVSGTATADDDYTALSGTVTVTSGTSSVTIPVSPLNNDTVVEDSETVIITLSANPDYIIGTPDTATVTIIDDDAPLATIEATTSTATEGGADGEFTVSLSEAPATDVTVNLSISGSATSVDDYTAIPTWA